MSTDEKRRFFLRLLEEHGGALVTFSTTVAGVVVPAEVKTLPRATLPWSASGTLDLATTPRSLSGSLVVLGRLALCVVPWRAVVAISDAAGELCQSWGAALSELQRDLPKPRGRLPRAKDPVAGTVLRRKAPKPSGPSSPPAQAPAPIPQGRPMLRLILGGLSERGPCEAG